MSTDTAEAVQDTTATEPVDDATIVHDDVQEERAEQERQELIGDVEKLLGEQDGQQEGTPKSPQAKPKQKTGEDDSKPSAEEDAEPKPDALSQATQARATEAGLTEDLAQRLHQSGLLEESLAAMDRMVIERFAQRQPQQEDQPEVPPRRQEQTSPQQDQTRSGGNDAPPPLDAEKHDVPPPLDPEAYGEELVGREAAMQKQLAALRSQVAQLTQVAGDFVGQQVDQQAAQFDQWFDGRIAGLENEGLFGAGGLSSLKQDSPQHQNRMTLYKAYVGMCEANGIDPHNCRADLVERAFPAMFPQDVFKQAQREVVDRLRNAQGQFISPLRPSGGGPPAKSEQMTEDERHDALVSDVDAYLKASS
jgi:hypothetical protein